LSQRFGALLGVYSAKIGVRLGLPLRQPAHRRPLPPRRLSTFEHVFE
jgi:hypothetical protein